MQAYEWYSALEKPFFSPPAAVFGPVWSVLYVLIALSFGFVIYSYFKKRIPFSVLLPFLLNLAVNFAFTPIQFGLRNNFLAALDILLVLGTLVWALIVIKPYARFVVFMNLPYLFWVFFATILQFSITALNW